MHRLERTIIRKLVIRGLASWSDCGDAGGFSMIRGNRGGGAEEIRTPDLLLAKETLYQLSHGPVIGAPIWVGPKQRPA